MERAFFGENDCIFSFQQVPSESFLFRDATSAEGGLPSFACFRTFEDDGFSRHSYSKCQNYKIRIN